MDFSKWAVVGFKDDTGIGRMTRDIQKVLGVGRHLVAPSERMQTKPIDPGRELLMASGTGAGQLKEYMAGLAGIICLERLHWNDHLVPAAKELGLKIVCVPMWEWFRGTDPSWRDADLFICPNRKAQEVLAQYGFTNTVHLAWPLDLAQLPERNVEGPARTFVHNAGLIDHDDRKGTRCVLKAFSKVRNPDLRLILRVQKDSGLPIDDPRIDLRTGNLEDPADLYKEGDAAIQPSRMEGLGFMVLEPVCCGMPVITTDAAPMNEYVTQPQLRSRTELFRKKSFACRAASIRHAYLTPPSISSLARTIDWCSHNDLGEISHQNRRMAQERYGPESLRDAWTENLARPLVN